MPSVFTIQGAPPPKRRRRRKPGGVECRVDECKTVHNPRTKRSTQLCCVGRAKSPTGWRFVKR